MAGVPNRHAGLREPLRIGRPVIANRIVFRRMDDRGRHAGRDRRPAAARRADRRDRARTARHRHAISRSSVARSQKIAVREEPMRFACRGARRGRGRSAIAPASRGPSRRVAAWHAAAARLAPTKSPPTARRRRSIRSVAAICETAAVAAPGILDGGRKRVFGREPIADRDDAAIGGCGQSGCRSRHACRDRRPRARRHGRRPGRRRMRLVRGRRIDARAAGAAPARHRISRVPTAARPVPACCIRCRNAARSASTIGRRSLPLPAAIMARKRCARGSSGMGSSAAGRSSEPDLVGHLNFQNPPAATQDRPSFCAIGACSAKHCVRSTR